MSITQKIRERTIEMSLIANARYQERYDNSLYRAATLNKSVGVANALIDEALALCGHPHYKVSTRLWFKEALAFLAEFC